MGQEPQAARRSHMDLLDAASVGLRSRVEEILARRGLTLEHWRVLRALVDAGPQPMGSLVGSTRLTAPTSTRIVDRLVETALAYRNVDPADRRRVVVHVADRGRELYASLHPMVAEAERSGLSALSVEETETLRRLLERIARAE